MVQRRSFISLATSLAIIRPLEIALASQTPDTTDEGPLISLLNRLPDIELGQIGIKFADYDASLAARGFSGSDGLPDLEAWLAAIGDVAFIPQAFGDPTNPVWREGLGFDLRDVSMMIEAGPSDEYVLLLTGRFEKTALITAWEASGYAAVDGIDAVWYTLGEDNVLRFDDEFHMSHLGALSHLALLDNGTVVGTAKQQDMEHVLAVSAGDKQSFGEKTGAALLASPPDIASGWIVAGEALVAPDLGPLTMPNNPNISAENRDRLATQAAHMEEEVPKMPPIAMALVGMTAGGAAAIADDPQPDAVAVVVPVDSGDVDLVAETVSRRLESESVMSGESLEGESLVGRAYSDLFTEQSVNTASSGAVIVTLTPAEGVQPSLLYRLAQSRNLSILYWPG